MHISKGCSALANGVSLLINIRASISSVNADPSEPNNDSQFPRSSPTHLKSFVVANTHLLKQLFEPSVRVQDDDSRLVGVAEKFSEQSLKRSPWSVVHVRERVGLIIDVKLHNDDVCILWYVHFAAHFHVTRGSST